MEIAGPILVALASVGGLLGLMELARRKAVADGWSPEVQRKLVHVATGLYAICLPHLFADDWPVLVLLGLTLIVMAAMRLPALRKSGAGALLHSVERRSYGDFMLAVAVGLVFLLSDRDPLLYTLPLAVLTLGDAAAALAGTGYGRTRFTVADGTKSLEGSVMLFLVTVILSMVCLLLLSDTPRANVVSLAILIAAFSTMVEADSWRGFDNLFLPLAVLILVSEHRADAPSHLIGLAIIFALSLVAFYALADRLGAPRHGARVYLLAAFLLLSVTSLQNAVFPLAMLALHLVTERRAPSTDTHPALDAVAALAVLSFAWLAAGNTFGLNAITFLGATMAGLVVALAALALDSAPTPRRLIGLALAAAVTVPLWLWLMSFNSPSQLWMPKPAVLLTATIALSGLAAALAPGAFRHLRMLRLTVLSATLPAVTYIAFLLTGAPA